MLKLKINNILVLIHYKNHLNMQKIKLNILSSLLITSCNKHHILHIIRNIMGNLFILKKNKMFNDE